MGKIILASAVFVLMVWGVNYFYPSLSYDKISLSKGQELILNFQREQKTFPKKIGEGIKGAINGVQNGITAYFMEKTGEQIVDLIETLPPQQQEEIKKEYCGE